MYLVNTSFLVEHPEHERWLGIIKEKYIPFLGEAGYEVIAFSRVISAEAAEHFTYSLLVAVEDMKRYEQLTQDVFDEYRAVAEPLFGDRVVWFTSLMKKI